MEGNRQQHDNSQQAFSNQAQPGVASGGEAAPVLTAQVLQNLEQRSPEQLIQQAGSDVYQHQPEPLPNPQLHAGHQRSPLGPAATVARKDSTASSCSSTVLLGRMSGVSLQRPDFAASTHQQQQQARQLLEQQAVQQQTPAGIVLGTPVIPQQTAACSSSTSPPLSPTRAAQHGSARPSADGSIASAAAASMQPVVPPQALGLPAIATTPLVPIPGTPYPAAAGSSPPAVGSPRNSMRSLNMTPQASAAAALSHATSLAVLAATHAQQQQQQQVQQQQQQAASAGGAGELITDDDLDSSSDDDDNYEFGETKIKRTFTRQQRRQRREQQQQQLVQQQQQQAAALFQQQQLQAQVLQQQMQAAELQAQLLQQQQQVAGGSGHVSPTAQGCSPSDSASDAAALAAMAAAASAASGGVSAGSGTSPLLAAVLRSSPPGSPKGVARRTSQGSQQGSTAAGLQQQIAEQQALQALLLAQQQQQLQQQQQVISPPGSVAAAGLSTAASLEALLQQVAPAVDWATAAPAAAAVAAAAGAQGVPVGSAGVGSEPSFVPVLEQTVSGISAASAASAQSNKAQAAAAAAVFPVLGSAGGAPTAAWLKGTPPASAGGAGGAAAGDVAGSLGAGSARGLNILGGTSFEGAAGSGPSFLTRRQQQQGLGGCAAGYDAAAAGAGMAAAGVGMASGGGGGDAPGKKEQTELKAEFQGLSLFNEEDDEDEGEGEEEAVNWYKRPMFWFRVVAFSLSGLLLLVGVLTQNVDALKTINKDGVELFRWMYFFAVWPALWMTVGYVTDKLFAFIEWWFYREALFYLDSVRRTARGLIFMCMVLPWFVLCFWNLWCPDTACEAESTYKRATDVVWKLMVCLTLFSLANFLKSVLTKLLSSHFYKTAHFMKVKAAIEKEYWLLMLSQPRPAPKPISEPPLSRLSHFVYNPSGHGGPEEDKDGVVPRSHSDTAGLGGTLRRRNKSGNRQAGDLPKPGLLASSVNFFSRRDSCSTRPPLTHAASCGTLGNGTTHYAPGQHGADGLAEHELTLTRSTAAGLAHITTDARSGARASDANGPQLSPDFTAKIVVSGFNIEAVDAARGAPQLDPSPSSFTTARPAMAAAAGAASFTSAGPFAAAAGVQPGASLPRSAVHQESSNLLDKGRSSSLRWSQQDAEGVTAAAAAAGAVGAPSEVNLQPFRAEADRVNLHSGSDAEESGERKGPRWGFWKKLAPSSKDQQHLLPDGHSPSSPTSQHTLVIQDSVSCKPVESSGTSKHFGSGPSSVFASPTAQQQHIQQRLGLSRLNSELNRKPGSGSLSVQRHSTDIAGAAASVAAGARASAAPAAGTAAAVTSDPLLQPGILEAVNLRVDGKAVDTATIKPAEWERLRTGIALKTFTALMKRYQNLTDAEEAKKLRDARRFAKGLFYHLRGGYTRPYVVRDDFSPFFASKESADSAFSYFDKDNDATISLKEMKDSVAAIFKERKNMAASLKDTDSIVNTLEFGIGFLLHFIFAAIYLLVWGMDIVKGFSTFSATVLALTFVFGNSVRQIFESMLFLFVEHAYDVGDLLEIELISYRVKKIDLMYTVLVKSTGERCYYPNTRLITLPVVNLTRSCAKSEKVVISLNVGQASNAAREALLAAVKEYYEENESDFNSCPSVNFVNLVDPFKAQLSVTWTYNFGADEGKRTSMVKTGLLQVVHSTLGKLPNLEYTLVKGKGSTGPTRGSDDGSSEHGGAVRGEREAPMGAGVAERQAANMATMGAAALGVGMLGGTAMMGTAGLAML